jgi:hypothetical protein
MTGPELVPAILRRIDAGQIFVAQENKAKSTIA